MAKTPRRKLKDKLETVVKEIVKIRDNYTCQHCLKKVQGANCHASHVIPVSRDGRLAFDTMNLKVLCYHCHINWWHKHPTEAGEWYIKAFPDRMNYLNEEHKQNRTKGTIQMAWLEEQYEVYRIQLENLLLKETVNEVTIDDLPF